MSSLPQSRSAVARVQSVHPFLLIGIGGALGSLARHGVLSAATNDSATVFALNIVGSFALGALTAWLQHSRSALLGSAGEAREHWAAFLGVGLCGGLTTFSTHMVDVAQRLDASAFGEALFSLIGTAAVAIASAGVGYELVRRSARTPDGVST